jgi:hypothetical protein
MDHCNAELAQPPILPSSCPRSRKKREGEGVIRGNKEIESSPVVRGQRRSMTQFEEKATAMRSERGTPGKRW